VEKKQSLNSQLLSRRLLDACDELYEGQPGDDTTIVTVKIRKPIHVLLLTGPPLNREHDKYIVEKFAAAKGKKIVCGGTAANIVSRELKKEIKTNLDYLDINIPPTASIEGVDLVTEGVLTLKRTIEMIYAFKNRTLNIEKLGKDGASLLFDMLISEGTHIDFWLGKALNQAHQDPGFPSELSMKVNVVNELKEALESVGKVVRIRYDSEVKNEKV
jgi:hypothetical protein